MAILIPRKKEFWQRKPEGLLEVDYGNDLTANLFGFVLVHDTQVIDLVSRDVYSATTSVTHGVDDVGEYISGGRYVVPTVGDQRTVVFKSSLSSSPLGGEYALQGKTGSNIEYYSYIITGQVSAKLSSGDFVFSGLTPVSNATVDWLVAFDGGDRDIQIHSNNEIYRGTQTGKPTSDTSEHYFGYDTDVKTRHLITYSSVKNLGDLETLVENPYQVIKSRRKYWVLPTATAGAAFQADLTSGSFSISPHDIAVEAASERGLTTASFSFSALSIEQVTSYTAELTTQGFGFTPLALDTQADFLLEPTVSSFLFSPQDISVIEPTEEDLTAGSFSFTALDIDYVIGFKSSLTLGVFDLLSQDLDLQADYRLDATAQSFNFTAQDILAGASTVFDLTSASFGFTATDLDYVAEYTADLTTQSFSMAPQSTEVEAAYEAVLTTGSFSYTANTVDVDTLPGVELGAANFSFMGLPLGGTIATGGAGARWIRSVAKVSIEQVVLRTQ